MYAHDGGGGGSYYGLDTHRELNAYVASASTTDLERLRRNWDDSGRNAHEMAELIESKLSKLVGPGGWSGPGAEAFAKTVRTELVANLRDYARRAGGYTPEGEQNVSHAHDLELIKEAVSGSYAAANKHNIPWDVDTTWDVRQKHVDQGLFSKLEEAVTGEDEDYEKAKKNAPYEVVNGAKSVLKEVPKPEYEPIESSVPSNPASVVYDKTNTQVAPQVKRFDHILERLGMGEGPKQHVYTAVNDVHKVLSDYAPVEVKQADTSDKGANTGSAGTNGPIPGGGGGGGGTGSNTPGPGDNDYPGPGDNDYPGPGDNDYPGPGDNDYPGPGDNDYPGPGDNDYPGPDDTDHTGPGDGGDTGGPGPVAPLPGDGPLTGGVGDGDTGAAGVGGGAPAAPPIGGIGGPAPAAAPGAVSVGAGPGVGGLGSLGGGMNAGAPGTSFSLGADGRPMVNTGKVGSLAGGGDSAAGRGGPGSGSGSQGGPHAGMRGAGGAGGPGAGGRRRTGANGEDEEEQELDETWLEEDQSVWGNRAAAPPSEIR